MFDPLIGGANKKTKRVRQERNDINDLKKQEMLFDRRVTYRMLEEVGVPVPHYTVFNAEDAATTTVGWGMSRSGRWNYCPLWSIRPSGQLPTPRRQRPARCAAINSCAMRAVSAELSAEIARLKAKVAAQG